MKEITPCTESSFNRIRHHATVPASTGQEKIDMAAKALRIMLLAACTGSRPDCGEFRGLLLDTYG